MRLLTRLGFDTGFEDGGQHYHDNIRAGFELVPTEQDKWQARLDEWPRILKGPQWSFYLKPFIQAGLLEVDHLILPVRDLDAATRSRLDVGLFWNVDPEDVEGSQSMVMAAALGRVVEAALLYEIPCTLMHFPTLVKDFEYCYQKLNRALHIDKAEMRAAFNELANPKQIKW